MKIINLDKNEKIPKCTYSRHTFFKYELKEYPKKAWHVDKCSNCDIIIVQRKEMFKPDKTKFERKWQIMLDKA